MAHKYFYYKIYFFNQDDEWISNAGEPSQTLPPMSLESQQVSV